MEKSFVGHFFKIADVRGSHVQSSLLPKFALFVLLVSTMLGLRAWGGDLVAVLFEFLDDDTKLAQSCTVWLYVQHWYTVVPDPAMRVTLWALMGAGGNCHEYIQDTPPVPLFRNLFMFLGPLTCGHFGSEVSCGRRRAMWCWQHILSGFLQLQVSYQAMYLSFARVWWISRMTNFECVLCSCSSVQLALSFFSVMSRSRWRPSGWKRHSRHHQVAERRGYAGALRLDHHGFGSLCQLCSQDTHWLHYFSAFLTTLHEYEAIKTFLPMPGQATLRGESGCSLPKALPGPSSSAPSTSSSSCRSVPLRVHHRRSERHTQTGKTHDICIYSFSYFRSVPQVVHGAASASCCGGVLEVRVV